MNYHPNSAAATLSAARGGRHVRFHEYLAILIGRHRRDWEPSWIIMAFFDGIRRRAEQLGYQVETLWLYELGMTPAKAARFLETRNIRGLVLLPESYRELPLEYKELLVSRSCAVVGGLPENLPFHFANNDLFATAAAATGKALELGYRRPGFAVLAKIDQLVSRRYSGGFLSVQTEISGADRIPVCFLEDFSPAAFLRWYREHRPDVIITHNRRVAVRQWLKPLGLSIPRDAGWISLDVAPGDHRLAGMDHRSSVIGGAALEIVVNQIQRAEFGVPEFQRGVFIEGVWKNGPTVLAR